MSVTVEKWDENTDGPLSEAAMEAKLKSRGYSVSCYEYPPGTYFSPHTHSMDKIDGVLSGQFQMEMHGQKVTLTAGDLLFVPKNTLHSAKVIGNETVISLDATKR